MGKYLCTTECYWNRRHWNPESPREKDRVYQGDLQPPEKHFRPLGGDEVLPKLEGQEPVRPLAFSELAKAGVRTSEHAKSIMDEAEAPKPVVDGQEVDVLS